MEDVKDIEKWSATSEEERREEVKFVIDPEAERRYVSVPSFKILCAYTGPRQAREAYRYEADTQFNGHLLAMLSGSFKYRELYIQRQSINSPIPFGMQGNAKLLNANVHDDLVSNTHLTNQEYLVALMIFIVAYTIFETPSNYMLKKFKPNRWLAFLMFMWGVMTMILGAVHSFGGIVAVRFLLGAFEAGLFPGMVYCLTFWYKPDERALRAALILACATLGGAFGGAIAYGVGHMDRVSGLQAWRWLFILEGIPSCVLAIFVFFWFPNFPETESWLSPEERELAIERIRGVASLGHDKITWIEAKATLLDWRLYLHYLAYITVSVPFSSISLFSPTIVLGLGYTGLQAQLFTVPPYAIAFVVTVLVSWASDKNEMRSWGAFTSLMIAGISFFIQGAINLSFFIFSLTEET